MKATRPQAETASPAYQRHGSTVRFRLSILAAGSSGAVRRTGQARTDWRQGGSESHE